MTDNHSTDNVIPITYKQDKVFNAAYADMIMVVTETMKQHPALSGPDWISMFGSMTGQLVFNADNHDYRQNFIRALAGVVSGICKHRRANGMREMDTEEFLRFVQMKK